MADQEQEFKPDTVVGTKDLGELKYATDQYRRFQTLLLKDLDPAIQSRLLASSAPGLDAQILLHEIVFFLFTHVMSKAAEDELDEKVWVALEKRAWKLVGFKPKEAANDPQYMAKVLAFAASRGADREKYLEEFKGLLTTADCAIRSGNCQCWPVQVKQSKQFLASLEAGAPEGDGK